MSKLQSNEDVLRAISNLQHYRKELRKQERSLKAREDGLSSEFQAPLGNVQKAKKSLIENLPEHLVPGNIGNLNSVAWNFWYSVDFDFGQNPTITPTLVERNSFTVTQEAAFILLAVSRSSDDNSVAGSSGPWGITFQDRQSSRFLNDRPIPFQMIGNNSNPMVFPTGYYMSPNAQIDVIMQSLSDNTFETTGSGIHQIMFHGIRIRPDADDRILSLIFG